MSTTLFRTILTTHIEAALPHYPSNRAQSSTDADYTTLVSKGGGIMKRGRGR